MTFQESLDYFKDYFFLADEKEQEALDNLQNLIALYENDEIIIKDLKKWKSEKENYFNGLLNLERTIGILQKELEYKGDNQRKELHNLNNAHSVLTGKYETLNKAMDKICMKMAHILYDYEDEEDPECQGVNLAYSTYLSKAKSLKDFYIKEAKK